MKRPRLPVAISGPPESWSTASAAPFDGGVGGAVALLERPRASTDHVETSAGDLELNIFASPDTVALFDDWELDQIIREATEQQPHLTIPPRPEPEPEPQPEPEPEPHPQPPPVALTSQPAPEPEPEPAPQPQPQPAALTAQPAPDSTAAPSKQDADPATSPKEKGLLHYLGLSLSAALLLLVVGLAALVIVAPAVVGGQALTVLTQSMEPGLPPGTLIVIRPQPVDDIRVGQVITYQIAPDEPAVVSHRVISKAVGSDGATTFITKGDNNDLPDENPVMEVQIRGTLWYSIPWLGYVNNAVNGDQRALVVPIAAGALFLYALVMVVGSARDRRRKRLAARAA